jgi:hypothetical protein
MITSSIICVWGQVSDSVYSLQYAFGFLNDTFSVSSFYKDIFLLSYISLLIGPESKLVFLKLTP